jgi:hypothetical protein
LIASDVLKNWDKIKNKKVFLFLCLGRELNDPGTNQDYENNFPKEIRNKIILFKLRGRIDFSNMNFLDKFLIKKIMKIKEFSEINRNNVNELIEKINND